MLRPHPAGTPAKLEAFAMLNGITASFVLQEQGDPDLRQRNAAYLGHAIVSGQHPSLAELVTQPLAANQLPTAADFSPVDRYPDLMARILTGILGPDQ
jgi:hypothetical protein